MKSFSSLLAAALLLGASSAANLKHRLQSPAARNFAEAQAGTAHTCQYAINRVNSESANYTAIVNAGAVWTDPSFPATSEMIRWSDYPGSDNMASYASYSTFQRLSQKFTKPQLFSPTVDALDIF